jgi:hypothetical protein
MEQERPTRTERRGSWTPIALTDCLDAEVCTPPQDSGPTLSPRIPEWTTNPSRPHPRLRKDHRRVFLSKSFQLTAIRSFTACRAFPFRLFLVAVDFVELGQDLLCCPQLNQPSWMREEPSRPAAAAYRVSLRFSDSSPEASSGPSP